MPEQPVKGEEALRRMAQRGLGQSGSSQKGSEEEKDPLKEARDFTKQMAASAIIESEVIKSKASAAKAEAEAEEAKARAARAKSGEPETKESPVKVTGEMSFGKIDYQAMLQQQTADLKELKKEAEESAGRTQQENNDLRERLHAKEMEVLKTSFEAQMQVLTKMIEANASKGSFMEQYNATIEMVKGLGYSQPQIAGDLSVQIELKKLDFEQARELKKLAREERMSDRQWQLELRRLDDEREAKKQELAQQAKRDDMFARAPQYLGGAIAQGLLASQSKAGRRVTEEATPETQAPRGKQGHHVEAGWGDSGEVGCPSCGEPVAIGPTARTAVCANCGERVPIRRTGERPTAEEE